MSIIIANFGKYAISDCPFILLVTVAQYYWTIGIQDASFIKQNLYLPLLCDQGKVVLDNMEAHDLVKVQFRGLEIFR